MSFYVSIGSSDDIKNLQKTQKYLRRYSELYQPEDERQEVKDLISWYDNIFNILFNGGNSEDMSDSSEFHPV